MSQLLSLSFLTLSICDAQSLTTLCTLFNEITHHFTSLFIPSHCSNTTCVCCHFLCHFPLVSFVSHHFPLFNFCFTIIDHSVSRWAFYGFYTFIVQPYFSLFALTLTTFFWNARSLMKFLRKGLKLNPRWWVFCFQDPFKETTFLSSHRVLHLEKWGIGFHGTQLLLLNSHYHFNG